MAISKTEICNKALTLIGAEPITSITDSAENAQVANRVYDLSLKSILSEAPWVFALKRELLARSAETLAWYDQNETIVYAKPNDMIRSFRANDKNAVYRRVGELIVSDTTGLGLEFTYYLDTPSKYTTSFIEAFVDKLCSDMAFMILNSKTVAGGFLDKYEKVSLSKAMAENAQIGTPVSMQDDSWTLAKFGATDADSVPGEGE